MRFLNFLGFYKMKVKWVCRMTPHEMEIYKSAFRKYFPHKHFKELYDVINDQWVWTIFYNPRDVAIRWNKICNPSLQKSYICVTAWYD